MTSEALKSAISVRRESVFGASVLTAGFSIAGLCFCPLFLSQGRSQSLFFSTAQEDFFFGLFGFISASWLLCWVASINSWTQACKLAQWLGLIFLCIDQVNLLAVLRNLSETGELWKGLWITPAIIQIYLTGSFFGFFTLPGLTKDGNRSLTGLGTLALLLPWLLARDQIVQGTQYLNGLFF